MANIATGFVRLFPKNRSYLLVGDILTLLCGWTGNSYHVPIVVRQDEFSLVTDFQFGDKWRAIHGNRDIWKKYQSMLEALWWRDFDDGGDHDLIGWIDATGKSQSEWCR